MRIYKDFFALFFKPIHITLSQPICFPRMKSKIITSAVFACAISALLPFSVFAGQTDAKATVTADKTEPTPLDLLNVDENYTGESTVRQGALLGKQDALHSSFDYSHRFHVTGQWYLRLGVAYERYDFGRSISPLPQHLQAASATVAYEYVVQGFAAAAIELHPGFYFENDVTGRNFDVPIDVYTAFKIHGDKVFGMVGFFEGQFINPPVIPIGGVIWLINDKTRLEAIFPRPSLTYTLNEDWELAATADIGGYGFRMDKNGRTPATYSGSVLQYSYYQAGLQVKYSGWKPFDLVVGGGYNFEREYDFFRNGPFQKYKACGAPYIKVSFEAKF